MKSGWQNAPDDLPRLDIRWLLQGTVETRIPTPDDVVTSTTSVLLDEVSAKITFSPFVKVICYFVFLRIHRKVRMELPPLALVDGR